MTVPIYERAIRIYEGNTFEKRTDGYYINSNKVESYTFKMDYYWMMGITVIIRSIPVFGASFPRIMW